MKLSNILILVVSLIVAGCGSSPANSPSDTAPPPETPFVPDDSARLPELNDLRDLFEYDVTWYLSNTFTYLDFSFGPINGASRFQAQPIPHAFTNLQNEGFDNGVIAVCWWRADGTRDVQYDREWWDQLTNLQQKQLVYHENGHCQLSREHRCSAINGAGHLSIMYPSIHSDSYLATPISILLPDYWGQSTMNYLELELFSKSNQSVDDCPTIKQVETGGDLAFPEYL